MDGFAPTETCGYNAHFDWEENVNCQSLLGNERRHRQLPQSFVNFGKKLTEDPVILVLGG